MAILMMDASALGVTGLRMKSKAPSSRALFVDSTSP